MNWHSIDGDQALAAIRQSGGWAADVSDKAMLDTARDGAVAVRFGAGRLGEVGAMARGLGLRRPLLVTYPGVRAAGHAAAAAAALEDSGLAVAVFLLTRVAWKLRGPIARVLVE